MHTNFRDCDAWRHEKLPMSTTSNEAAKLYDASLSQLVGWYENAAYNGLLATLNSMTQVDPDFALGQCLKYDLELLGSNQLLNCETSKKSVSVFVEKALSRSSDLTSREIMHVKAVAQLQKGNLPQACNLWENILLEHPTDMMAIKMAHTGYFYLGCKREMRDSIARVIPAWKANTPLYAYLHGMQAFGLTQTSQLELAKIRYYKIYKCNDSFIFKTVFDAYRRF